MITSRNNRAHTDVDRSSARPGHTPRHTRWLLIVVLASSMVATTACSSTENEIVAGAGDLGHIHDLVLDDDGVLLAATHTGLYRIEDVDRAVLIGSDRHDLMSMTMTDGDLLASGHPDLRLEEYRVDDRPPFFGLARSSDGGENWDATDLLGDADFHALVPHSDGLFGAETSGQIWFLNPETSEWTQLGEVAARDLAVDPTNADRQLAPDYDGRVWVSIDRATTWNSSPDAPPLIEIEWPTPGVLIGVDEAGTIWSADEPDGPWTELATGPAEVETLFVDDTGRWWITTHGGTISRSDDQGISWDEVYTPPSNS